MKFIDNGEYNDYARLTFPRLGIPLYKLQGNFYYTTKEDSQISNRNKNIYVDELGLSERSTNCLHKAGIITLADLLAADTAKLMSIVGFGKKSLAEVKTALQQKKFI